ncbi:unnamed protein product [Closterium sp. NIES-53]
MRSSKRPSKADLASHVPAETNDDDDEQGEQSEADDVEEMDPLRPAAANISEEEAAHIPGDEQGEENPYLATGTLKSAIHRCQLPLLAIDQDSTRPNYVSGFMHFKAWACATLVPGKNSGVPVEEQVINEDEVGREIGKDLGKGWRAALLNEEHLHGPWTSKWRLRAYVEYMSTETDEQAASLDTERTRVAGRKPKKCTPPMMLARLTALGCLCKVEAILFGEPLTKPMDDITEARQLLAVKLRQLHDYPFESCVDPHHGSLDDVYTEEQFRILVSDILPHWAKVYFGSSMAYPSLSLWKALAVRQCGFGAVFLWLHFLFDLVPLYYNNENIVAPLDFSNPEAWSKKYLFFAIFDKEKTEMPYPTHNKWVTWAMNSAVWILSKVTHIFRRSAAQILADKNLDLDSIAQVGQWDMNEMRRSYVTGIPRPAIQMQAGFSQEPGDYYIGRSKTKVPPKVLKAIEEHIFPKAELWLIEDHPFDGVSVCECERHPYVQMSGLCKGEDFQKWALDVYTLDKYGIEMRTNPTMSRATDVSSHLNTKHLVTQLRAEINLHKEERGKREIQINHLEKQVESLEWEKSSMKAELEAKTEAFAQLQKAFDALKNTAATSAAANVGESESVPQTATEEATPDPQQAQQATPSRQSVGSQLDQTFFDVVVWPWCNCETVRKAWSYWDGANPLNNGQSLRQAYKRGFAVKLCKFTPTPPPVTPKKEAQPKENPPSAKAIETKMRKMEAVMQAVEHFRIDDSSAATSMVIEKLDSIVKGHSINMLSEGMEDSGRQLTKKRKVESAEENRKDKQRLRITLELIRVELRTAEWAEKVFGKEKWKEFTESTSARPSSTRPSSTSNRDEGGP